MFGWKTGGPKLEVLGPALPINVRWAAVIFGPLPWRVWSGAVELLQHEICPRCLVCSELLSPSLRYSISPHSIAHQFIASFSPYLQTRQHLTCITYLPLRREITMGMEASDIHDNHSARSTMPLPFVPIKQLHNHFKLTQ